jgi:hypothetical protein
MRGVGTLASPWQEEEDLREQDEGDASVPSPHDPSPAPTEHPPSFLVFPVLVSSWAW